MEIFHLDEQPEVKNNSVEEVAEQQESSLVEVKNEDKTLIADSNDQTPAIENYARAATQEIEKNLVQSVESMDFHEGSKSIAHIAVTAAALDGRDDDNTKFLKEIKEEKQKEIKQSFTGERFKEEAKKYEAQQRKAEAFYTNFRPILEFDFSPLIPKNEKTIFFKKKNQTTGSQEPSGEPRVEAKKPTYQDRSYGIPLMVLMLFLLTIPYCLITIILAIGNGINAIFNGIARFGKPALIICGTLVGVAISILAVYCAIKGIDALFGTNILGFLEK